MLGPNLWGPRLPGMAQMIRDLGPLAVSCLQWRTCVEMSCHFGRSLPSDQYFELHLEDFSADIARQLMVYCALPPNDAVTAFIEQNFDKTRARARSTKAKPEQIAEVSPWLASTMQWLGYTDD